MMNLTYWYPMSDWTPGSGGPDPAAIREAAERYETMGVTNLVIGIDGRKMSYQWDYLEDFDSRAFREDLEEALGELYAGGFSGQIEIMPINGYYNWETQNHQRSFWMIDATLNFLRDSAYRDKVAGIVTDTEFGPTPEWRDADDAGKAEILRQYAEMLAGINDRVKTFDDGLATSTYHGAYIDRGDDRYMLDGVNYGDAAVIGAHVDRIILPIRLTDAIDPDGDHDFDRLVSRALDQTAEELAHLSGSGKRILIDFEWEESHRDLGAPNFYAQLRGAFTEALLNDPAFAGFAVFISPTLSTVEIRDLRIDGLWVDDSLTGTTGNDTIRGRQGDDTLSGGDGEDVLNGQAGDDLLSGGAGKDVLLGGRGRDRLVGGDERDRLAGGDDADTLEGGQGNDRLFGNAGDDTLFGNAGGDRLFGRTGSDLLDGGYGNDTLRGGTGDDTLDGGGNDDTLHGGFGADVFVFAGDDFGQDVVLDFVPAEDRVVFGPEFPELADFGDFATATTQAGPDLVFDLDGDGVNRIRFAGLTLDALSETDFLFL